MRRFLFAAALLLYGSLGSAQAAIIYDAVDDFSLASNPNGAWSLERLACLKAARSRHTR